MRFLSGLRRITAWRELADEGGPDAIPAFVRPEMDPSDALAAVIEENEIRETVSPWEKGRVIWLALDEGFFDNAKAATRALFPTSDHDQGQPHPIHRRSGGRVWRHLRRPPRHGANGNACALPQLRATVSPR